MKEIESKRKNGEDEEGNKQEAKSDDLVIDPSEVIHSKEDNPLTNDGNVAVEPVDKGKSYFVFSSEGKCPRVIHARDKFPCCNSAVRVSWGKIPMGAGCRNVAY